MVITKMLNVSFLMTKYFEELPFVLLTLRELKENVRAKLISMKFKEQFTIC